MIRVLLVDDHGVIRDGLGRLISALDGVTLVGAAADGAQAVEQHALLLPDVVLMDLDMPVMDGIEATKRIIARRSQTAVVVLTAFGDQLRIIGALAAGASGYLLKDVDAEKVGEAIRVAARGESPLDPRVASTVLDAKAASGPLSRLSPRERQVLALLVEGLSNKLIARRLQISEKTVKSHLTQIFRELQVTDRTQAALWGRSPRRDERAECLRHPGHLIGKCSEGGTRGYSLVGAASIHACPARVTIPMSAPSLRGAVRREAVT